jgi:hypothetical protein
MFYFFPVFVVAFCTAAFQIRKKLCSRVEDLERNLQSISTAMSQMMELQMETHRKYSAAFRACEERILELSVPLHDPSLPLERRHQVLALSRQGADLEEIVKRLKAPVGEAELILNLTKYMSLDSRHKAKMNEQVKQHG